MITYSPLSLKAWTRITRDAVSWEQNHDSLIGYKYRVTYPNGYGLSIVKTGFTGGSQNDLWEVAVLKDDRLYIGKDSNGYIVRNRTEDDVVLDCIFISGL